MAKSENPEHAINAIISLMGDNIASYMSTIDTEWGDSITLQTPSDYYRAPLRQYPHQPPKPIVVVEADETGQPDRYRVDAARIQGHSLQVGVIIRSSEQQSYQGRTLHTPEVLNIRMSRTLQAIQRLLQDNDKLIVSGAKNADKLLIRRVNYPFVRGVPKQANLFEKMGWLDVFVYISP